MPRKPNLVSISILEKLKNQVIVRSNLDCRSFVDMQQLQQEIRRTMNEYLSLQTLNRLFGIIRSDFNPSLHTLNVLSQYLQYRSFTEFAELNDQPDLIKKQASFESKFIFSVFASVDPEKGDAQALQTVIRNILNIIHEDPQMSAGIYAAMASIPFGRKYFFEKFINMDGLAMQYGDGLSYYLLYAVNRHEQLFAYNLYCMRYFLTGNDRLFARYFSLLNGFPREEIGGYQPHYAGSYCASVILNRYIEGKTADKQKAVPPLTEDMPLSGHPAAVCLGWYHIAEALVLTGEFENAWQKINRHLPADEIAETVNEDLVTQIGILRLISGFYSGNLQLHKARQLFSELNAAPLNTIVQHYFSILLSMLKKSLFPNTMAIKETDLMIDRLIKKTGFTYFSEYQTKLNNYYEKYLMDINGKKRY